MQRDLAPGSGHVDLALALRPDYLGTGVEYRHQVSEGWSAFGEAYAGLEDQGDAWRPTYGVTVGARYSW